MICSSQHVNYEYSDDKESVCKIKDIYSKFTQSSYYFNSTKAEKKKYTKSFFADYIKNNIFFREYFSLSGEKYKCSKEMQTIIDTNSVGIMTTDFASINNFCIPQ